jgi:hypothetical protein
MFIALYELQMWSSEQFNLQHGFVIQYRGIFFLKGKVCANIK